MFFKKKEKSYKENIDITTVDENFSNLLFFTQLLDKIEHFVFFGTLLGLVRENNLIEGDDDIDLYVNINQRNELINILRKNSVKVNLDLEVNKNESFLQVRRQINSKNVLCDFYFYEVNKDDDFIVEKWNFEGGTSDPTKHLRIPKIFIYPIQKKEIKSTNINFPAQPLYLCEFIYGKNWKSKLKKDIDYEIRVLDCKPVLYRIKKNFLGLKKYYIE
tara:strand:+ start:219 stop:869 length:651 start_codon:yes stop_codon:yes gene_type:complete